jgi:single-strand DNA-binding protein
MADVNKMIILGRLGNDPELKTVGSSQVCQFSVATNEHWNDKDGNKQERTEWTTVVVWGKRADSCAKYLKKGHQVYVEGRKKTRMWEKDGQKHYAVELVAEQVTFLNNKDGGSSAEPDHDEPPQRRNEDDIPF